MIFSASKFLNVFELKKTLTKSSLVLLSQLVFVDANQTPQHPSSSQRSKALVPLYLL